MSDSVRPHRWQPTRLPRPWDSPGKNTGVGCHFLLQCMKVKSQSEVAQSCPTLSDPMDCSPPGSPVHGIFQARVLEWGAIAFSSTMPAHISTSLSLSVPPPPSLPFFFLFFLCSALPWTRPSGNPSKNNGTVTVLLAQCSVWNICCSGDDKSEGSF